MKVIAGNCVIEDFRTSVDTAEFLLHMSDKFGFDLIYKSSWRKDNRSQPDGYVGVSIADAVNIFNYIHNNLCIPTLTDFHEPGQLADELLDVIDVVQIPAYLCMQSGLVYAVADTGKCVNIKKGQFLHPSDVKNVIDKVVSRHNHNIIITERGTCFGYRDLVLDPRSLQLLKEFGYPVFCDVGHLCRKYGISSSDLTYGGDKKFVNTLAKSAVAIGIDGIFVEVHPNPSEAMCDAATQLSFDEFTRLVAEVLPVWRAVNED